MVSARANMVTSPLPVPPTMSWREMAAGLRVPADPQLADLTPAEQVVVTYLRQGMSNKEIARALGKAEATVKHQVSACLAKFGVRTRTRLIALLS
ncbi:MAG: LuxR C-terminal-related transcriptional regulator [Cephaloticoccus sp.]|nr:LuxR C-terminal-related transcriptional regulator [Cephaloticoccus sp.]MCF7759340.1 LuxR C-terminal-related transcriptional regulator [Cephaloticoccus sp.]